MQRNMDSEKLDRPLAVNPQFKVVGEHKLSTDEWVIIIYGVRAARWRARCSCGEASGVLTTSGMVAGWYANHLEEVCNAGTK